MNDNYELSYNVTLAKEHEYAVPIERIITLGLYIWTKLSKIGIMLY